MEVSKLYLFLVLNIYYNVIWSGLYFQLRHNYKEANLAIFYETFEGREYYIIILNLNGELVQFWFLYKSNLGF